ncbi:peroxin [Metarhizium acridum CQMa 102]|uniref:Peroxin n=1 Tax=Metarhizium acridum (strain CQMa 102) TaxID=655827 RepID=E9DU70_METAQ|nr:peroxin [Metarhizium acridum CQMa 102]EFY92930.1 peroxin [Metarhizium acridum CQMa 102]
MDAKPVAPEEIKEGDVEVKTTDANAAAAEAPKPAAAAEDVPDPDEDDLDDLDDMLDEFSTVKLEDGANKPIESGSAGPSTSTPKPGDAAPKESPAAGEEPFSEEDFAKQLQAGMADLLGELEQSPEMQQQFEDMFKQMAAASGDAAPATGAAGSSSAGAGAPGAASEASFQETIRRTMERMQASGDQATAAAATTPATGAAGSSSAGAGAPGAASEASFQETIRRTMERMPTPGRQATAAAATSSGDDFMSELLKQMSSGDFNGEGSEEEFSKMLMGMMEQLTNKDILYEPMKELDDKFPEWFEKNKASTPAEDLKRYEEQRVLVREIVAKFEESSYSDSNASDREYIVDRMQKMQAAGSPPSDLVGDMASAQEAFGGADDQCNPQ